VTANERSKKLTFKQISIPSLSPMNTLVTSFKAGEFFNSFQDCAVTAFGVLPLISCRACSNVVYLTETFMRVILVINQLNAQILALQ